MHARGLNTDYLDLKPSPCQYPLRVWCILALKYDIWWHQFLCFPESQLTKFRAVSPFPLSWCHLGERRSPSTGHSLICLTGRWLLINDVWNGSGRLLRYCVKLVATRRNLETLWRDYRSDELTAAIGLAFCRTSDAEGDGADEPEGEGGRVDGVHAVGDVGRVRSRRRRRCRGRQRRLITALLADVHGRSAGQLRVGGLHVQHEPVSTAASQPAMMARTSSSSSSGGSLLL